jgi:hypothetical protein
MSALRVIEGLTWLAALVFVALEITAVAMGKTLPELLGMRSSPAAPMPGSNGGGLPPTETFGLEGCGWLPLIVVFALGVFLAPQVKQLIARVA